MLDINNLHVKLEDEDREIIRGLTLSVKPGEVHAIMGPNGSGKSTLSYVLAGREGYEVTEGSVTYKGEDLLEMETSRARRQGRVPRLPVPDRDSGRRHHAVPEGGAQFAAQGARREGTLHARLHAPGEGAGGEAERRPDMLKRPVNVGFSGGEKKRAEILQMAVLEPSLCILDETDSGLDIDALRVVADGVNALRSPDRAMIVITHYQRLLDYIVPDFVHVLSKGRIVKSGDKSLALELEARGYAEFEKDAA